MGCVREGWLVASPAVRHSDHYCSDDERQSQESAGHERSPRRLNIFSRQGYLFRLWTRDPDFLVLSSFSRSGAMFGGEGGADGEVVS